MAHEVRVFHYLFLFLILMGGFLGFTFYRGNSEAQFLIIFFTVSSYVVWGIWHHKVENRLSWGVITEYILVGSLVLLLFYLTLLF